MQLLVDLDIYQVLLMSCSSVYTPGNTSLLPFIASNNIKVNALIFTGSDNNDISIYE